MNNTNDYYQVSDPIDSFSGEYRWLSNFYPVVVILDGVRYPSVEHAYQAAKADGLLRNQFVNCTAGQAKRLGRSIQLRSDWSVQRQHVMVNLIVQKFNGHNDLSSWLVNTGDRPIIEGNTWGDTYWGVCNGVGQNNLGKILMARRTQLIERLLCSHNGE